jgi:hypothetical protein
MTIEKQQRVERTRRYMLESDLPEEVKDLLGSLLDEAAHAANGASDKMQAMADTLLALAVHEVKQSVRLPSRIREAAAAEVKLHMSQCVLLRGLGPQAPRWAVMLYPFRWPAVVIVSVLGFAPRAGELIDAISKLIRGGG